MTKPTGKKPADKKDATLAEAFERVREKVEILSLLAESHEAEIRRLRDGLASVHSRIDAAEAADARKTIWQRIFGKSRS